MDFLLWPRKDIDYIECRLFSRWKGDEETPYKPLKVTQTCKQDKVVSYIMYSDIQCTIQHITTQHNTFCNVQNHGPNDSL